MIRILSVFGTRPEAIKMGPLVNALRDHPTFDSRICITGQHREMLEQVLSVFNINPDYNLNIMAANQDLAYITQQVLMGTLDVLDNFSPDILLTHGDTTTTLAASLAAFYRKIPVGHIEAGLRTGNNYAPYPEEINRKLSDAISNFHFAPTRRAAENLKKENIPEQNITVTGNTVIDALFFAKNLINQDKKLQSQIAKTFTFLNWSKHIILVTGHRRENFGVGFENVCYGLETLAKRNDVQIIYPVHLNPNVREPVTKILSQKSNVHLIEPLDYLPFIYIMEKSHFIITDSGGIQEEAPSLGKPVIITREITERPEALQQNIVRLVGTNNKKLVDEANLLLDDENHYRSMSKINNLYGDGKACDRIIDKIIKTQLC